MVGANLVGPQMTRAQMDEKQVFGKRMVGGQTTEANPIGAQTPTRLIGTLPFIPRSVPN